MWDISDPAFSKLRHIHIHLSSTIGKIARALEPLDHHDHRSETLDTEALNEALAPVVADLIIHAAQISSALGQDLSATLMDRYRHNAQRFAPASEFTTI
jgi:NTP pyrophosphatase (non-canonical NTP hydrolase)